MTEVESFLLAEREMMKRCGTNQFHGYFGLGDFILKHGRLFAQAPLPSDVQRGQMKECFRNSALLALERSDLVYCEGYAISVIPVYHGWCVTRGGLVVDSTWPDGRDYFGVPIRRAYLIERLMKRKRYGLLDDWENDWPMLQSDKKKWMENL